MKVNRGERTLKIMLLVFLLTLLGNAIEYFFVETGNLKKVKGKVSKIIHRSYLSDKYRYTRGVREETIVEIENVNASFSVSDWEDRGADINGVEKGDEITIYVRKWYQYILTLGYGYDIYGLEKNGVFYYDLSRWKGNNIAAMKLSGILFLFFGGLYILQRVTINRLLRGEKI